MYTQLAAALRDRIESGDLPAGSRLPSERELSTTLGVSRTTVVAAYDRLRDQRILRSHRGSGTSVARVDRHAGLAEPPLGDVEVGPPPLGEGPFEFGPVGDDIELTVGALPGSEIVTEEAERVAREDLPGLIRTFGYQPLGLPALRRAIAAHMTSLGIPTIEDQVLVTSGAQQAIDLLARFFGGPHMSVIVEDPTYPPAIDSFRATGARFVPVPLDAEGVRSDLIAQHARRGAGQVLFLNPICQNPTGTLLSEARAREIARVAADTGTLVIDDITSAYLLYDGSPVPIAVHDRDNRVITVGSLSKVAWGGLRIGWIRASRSLVNQLAARKIDTDISTNLFTQAVGVRMLGRFDELVARARLAALDRLGVTEAALGRLLPSWTWTRPAGGLCLWVRLPAGDAASFAHVAASHGVIVRPGQQFSASGGHRDRMRIAYGHEPETLEMAYLRLAAAWRDFRPTDRRRTPSLAITV